MFRQLLFAQMIRIPPSGRSSRLGPAQAPRARGRARVAGTLGFAIAALAAYCTSAGATGAHSAGTISGVATGRLHLVRAEGSTLIEEGPVSGALTGRASARLKTGAAYTATFTIRTSSGVIHGRGQAQPGKKPGRYESFRGSFVTLGGSGRYAHITGSGGLYGVFDRRADSVVIQTTGRLAY